MRSASDQLSKRVAFDQMCNVWPNAHSFGQMLSVFVNAEHQNSNLLPLTICATHVAIGAREASMPRNMQLGRTGATHRMVSRRWVSRW